MYQIHNNVFCLSVSNIGAELEELCINGRNILWRKNELWNSQSPILFPIVGSLKDNYYVYEKEKYELSSHGFLREQGFQLCEKSEDKIRLVSKYNDETLKRYPFKYEFYVTYQIIDNRFKIIFEIKNIDEKDIYFSCGFHPGFDYNGLKAILDDDFKIHFSPTKVKSILFDPVYIEKMKEEQLEETSKVEELSKLLIQNNTICYEGLKEIELRTQTKRLIFKNDMPYMAFWQKQPENPKFLCIESWYGLPDEKTTNHLLKEKIGIQRVKVGDTFSTQLEISYIEGVKNENN